MATATVERVTMRDDKQVRFGGDRSPRAEGSSYEPLIHHEPPPLG